jgi:hypothetical protein
MAMTARAVNYAEAFTYRRDWASSVPKTLDTIKMMEFIELEGGGGVEAGLFA